MASLASAFTPSTGMKRGRAPDDEPGFNNEPQRKHARPTFSSVDDLESWQHDSVISTPTTSTGAFQQRKYDSDEHSSMMSEPGSPQDISMSSDDDDMDGAFSNSPEDTFRPGSLPTANSSPWRERTSNAARVPTPFATSRLRSPVQSRNGPRQHVRQRHPQEIFSSDHLEVPASIEENNIPTPPSAAAAEAAGSQLSMLSVNDMDIETSNTVPTITVDPARSSTYDENYTADPGFQSDAMDSGSEHAPVRRQRQRSGAQSHGSASPARPTLDGSNNRKGFSVGFRADCEKCQMRVPGHMNHFIL